MSDATPAVGGPSAEVEIETMTPGTPARYLVCIARAGTLAVPEGGGLEPGQTVRVLELGGLEALVIDLPADYFDRAADRLEDVEWVGPRAVRHEVLLEQSRRPGGDPSAAAAPVLPARFGTVFTDEERLRETVLRHEREIVPWLERTAGRDEWRIRIMMDRERAVDALVREQGRLDRATLAKSPGARYFQEKKIRREAERDLNAWLQGRSASIRALVDDVADETKVARVTDRKREGREIVLAWSALIDRDREGELEDLDAAVLEQHGEAGLELEIQGPFAVYDFCPRLG